MKTDDRVAKFVWTTLWGMAFGISLSRPGTPWWFWLFLAGWAASAYWYPEIMQDAERRGRMFYRLLNRR